MRRRITFVQSGQDQIDPKHVQLHKDKLQLQGIRAAREDRITASPHELPQEACFSLDKA